MRTACTAVIKEDAAPQISAVACSEADAADAAVLPGTIPKKKPKVTVKPAMRTCVPGEALASSAETAMVNGNTRPRAIYGRKRSC